MANSASLAWRRSSKRSRPSRSMLLATDVAETSNLRGDLRAHPVDSYDSDKRRRAEQHIRGSKRPLPTVDLSNGDSISVDMGTEISVIANSLIFNKNLQSLDMSNNLMGDLGVYLLLTPLIR